ncbi:MAG: 2,3-bisphosphoglycerate-independent phosphoglycerate mutase [Bacteroidales bacterium]|jgi:2,3-bisphosphoglycerate-independent phosphoglycerate mutase|nr:2,3-bisphosphoglycerate-independent phosphoglycerate mutase [Bacteroidales bacterium]MDD2569509.1 2,3-bisphosphoglycerate-independent phosphoglycerate mutase [Bacteroidales bacterium]MDD2813125.1 2,3-bisphosphoglycerate-independent phosphoglycerate mutase [Bacteroidales bacterium]MDD3384573.1 2,3-bisphosphoglycerate-independent phosphoglycerate mutase [Bacteroidales bacterium]MDD3811714.1 2,3-bisphosphoglycerate-independent phosphoglycerate mutase [Bacteroidales bacterium]
MNNKLILMILDGWGCGVRPEADAIRQASTPFMDSLLKRYPHSKLKTSGEDVGLPDGQMGNSEVGHLNIGAGRVVYQDLVKINRSISDGSIRHNAVLDEAFSYARDHGRRVHFVGLLSDGGVHSMDRHLYALCDLTRDYGLDKVFIHAITDGRDTDPFSGLGYIRNLEDHLSRSNGTIASLIGRYYAMDRDKRWERIKLGYDLYVHGKGKPFTNILDAIQDSYDEGITDEFIKPVVRVDESGQPVAVIEEDDVVICFNFRSDRLREMTVVLTQKDMPEAGMKTIPLHYYTMTPYDETFKKVSVIFDKDNVTKTLGELMAAAGKKQLRIAETEKYAHVTFFFSGGREEVFPGENRIMIPSPKVPTYDLQPEMSAYEVRDAVVKELKSGNPDFICLNFANGDMVGHTGVWDAIIQAIEAVDTCVQSVVETAIKQGYSAILIADHGNADNAVNQDGSPNTAHSLNPVPCIVVDDRVAKVKNGILADVAPTILDLMGMPQPAEMTGKSLVEYK